MRLDAANTKIGLLNDEIMRLQLEVQMRKRKDDETVNTENKMAEMDARHRKELRKLQAEHDAAVDKAADEAAEAQRTTAAKESALLREMDALRLELERAKQLATTSTAAAFRDGELQAAEDARRAAVEVQRRHHDEVSVRRMHMIHRLGLAVMRVHWHLLLLSCRGRHTLTSWMWQHSSRISTRVLCLWYVCLVHMLNVARNARS